MAQEGRFNLNTYSNLRERAQTLKVANDNKDLANRKLKDEIANLKLTIHKHAQPWHEQRIASTMIAKKAVWERSTAHMVDTYAECPVCEGGSGGAFSLSHTFSHFLCHTRSIQPFPVRARALCQLHARRRGEGIDLRNVCRRWGARRPRGNLP